MTWWDPRTWRRRPMTTAAAVVTVPALVLSLALLDRGFPLARVELNDGGVWLTATSQLSLGRYNVPVEELDGGLVTTGGTFDVLQDAGDVLLVEPAVLSVVDPVTVTTTTQVAIGGVDVDMAAGRVVLVDRDGGVWVRTMTTLDGLRVEDDAPDLELGEGGRAVVATSGVVLAVSPEDGAVTRVPALDGAVQTEEAGAFGALELDALTAVGDEAVALSGSTVHTPGGAVTVDDEGLVLQQPGPQASSVLVAGSSALWEVPLDGGAAREHPTTGSGPPAAPVRVGSCAYAAWSSTVGSSLRLCDGQDAVVEDLEGMRPGDTLAFRVNRGMVVLNETAGGRVWLPQLDTQVRVPNWEDVVPEEDPEDSQEESDGAQVTQQPVNECAEQSTAPVAVDDTFGVRPGRTRLLPVIDNDSSSDCGILVVSEFAPLPEEFGTVEAVQGGRALQVRVADGATGSAELTYTVTDGRGLNAPSTATVVLTVSDGDAPPTQVRTSTATVDAGGFVEHAVLADFADPDGDDLLLVGASADPAAGTARFRQDGVLTFTADGGTLGRTQVTVQVSDGTNVVDGVVEVDVRAAGSVPPRIDPVHAVTYVGQEVTLRPLDAVRSGSAEPARLAAVGEVAGATIVPDLQQGTFTFRAARSGPFYVQFVVTAAPQQATGLARIDVLEWPEEALPPVAVRDVAYLPAGGEVTVDPLANDEDPAGNVLVVQRVDVPDGSGLEVALLEHRYVQISARRTLDAPVVLDYQVSNGSASAVGQIVVQPVAPNASQQPPVVPNVEVRVRTGGVVTIPVLEGASDPDGDELTLLRQLPEPLAEGQGLLFVSGDVLRYQAPDEPITARATFAVEDATGNVTAATVTVRVHESDPTTKSPPRPRDVVARVFEGETVRIPIPLVGIDDDGDGVTLLGQASAATLGRVTTTGPDWLEYESFAGSTGTDTFTYAVEDWVGQRAVATIRVGVAPRPTQASTVQARPDEVTLRPGQRVEVRVLANDLASGAGELTLEEIVDMPEGLDAEVAGRRIALTAPDEAGVLLVVYRVADSRGGTDTGVLTVTVDPDAPVLPPVARDVTVPAIDTLGRTEVRVDVLEVAQNPSGPTSDLEVGVPTSHRDVAQVTDEGDVVVTLADQAQTVPYVLVNSTDRSASAYAFITVPALGFFPPQVRPRAPELRVAEGEQLRIDLGEQVQVAPGRTARIADAGQVTAVNSDGSALVQDDDLETLHFRARDGYVGPASISVLVTDATDAGDETARTSLITLPITVYALDDYPPTFGPAALDVGQGDAARAVDLLSFTTGPEGPATVEDGYTYRITSPPVPGFTVALDGSDLRVSANASTPRGTTAQVEVTIGYGRAGSMTTVVDLAVVASTQPLATVRAWDVPDGVQGQTTSVPVLDDAYNPFPGSPLTVTGATVETPGAGTASATSSSVAVRPADDFVGQMSVRYRVRDATGDPAREVEGRVTVRVRGVPATPVPPRVGEVRDRTVVLSWTAPDSRGEPITEYQVTASPSGRTYPCASTTCTIDELQNDVEHTFTVAARNAVGWSEPSASSAPARPDAVPDAPAAPSLEDDDRALTATWSAPTSTGSPITSYTLEITPAPASGPAVVTTPTTSYRFTGLTNGTAYTVRVRAQNRAPEPSAWSPSSAPETPAGVPTTPVVTAERKTQPWGDTAAIQVSWTVASSNGDEVAEYEVRVDGAATCVSNGPTSCTISPAERGRTYAIAVRARNKAGWSAAGTTTGETISAPTAPQNVALTAGPDADFGQGTAELTWNAPTSTGGAGITITGYRITGPNLDTTVGPTVRSRSFSGLGAGALGPFTVTATSSRGLSGDGATSGSVTIRTRPQQPTVTASPGGVDEIVVSFADNGTGGASIDAREYRVDGAPVGSVDSPYSTQDRTRFEYRVRNAVGWSPWASAESDPGQPSRATVRAQVLDGSGTGALRFQIVLESDGGRGVEQVQWQLAGPENGSDDNAAVDDTVTLNDLDAGTYTLTLRARNAVGWSDWTAPLEVMVQ
ncbi:tandem-95 repeat protein [Cellulomonas sp. SLBN-39]|uniref:Ig-like domain-containing protein n=1 Tax=Cellulomonas sp. SLBN-39 TaxID=2768446 RepID=UPI001169CD13|nr:tandem-95 repeat protein [Cellulomonas sp. SLBN-39]TQL03815.1 fibronectin type III domain protein [Cellulomonas sp. SLBN-39]